MTREPKNEAERHMVTVWFVRAVAWATGYDEDFVAILANIENRKVEMASALAAAVSWQEWAEGCA